MFERVPGVCMSVVVYLHGQEGGYWLGAAGELDLSPVAEVLSGGLAR